ncbi:MAG: membrane protein insertase YidC [Ruminococcus sp.]|nr:membrane protein insertase YidC [Ruminococcus sp.]
MNTLINWIAVPLGYVMNWCFRLISNYGLAIILFTLLTKIIILPLSVWVQKNSIKMVRMQPEINRIKAKFFGDKDTIADEESKLHKKYKYNPLASLVPLIIQIILLMGVVGVIYNPMNHLFRMPDEFISAANTITIEEFNPDISEEDSALQLYTVENIKTPEYRPVYEASLSAEFPDMDVTSYLDTIEDFNLQFLGINLSHNPSIVMGITIIVPLIAGFSSYLLCIAQNKSNVLQAEQGKGNKWGMLIFSVGLSLVLGFFVPAGTALYWVASNLFAILQLYALNAVIPPKKFVDYEALEESRKELAALESLGEKKKLFAKDENAKREKEDYKRFFSIRNKHIVFYSERSGFYRYYKEIIEYLNKKTNVAVHYITNDPNDIVFELAKDNPKLKPYYIGVKKLITLMMKIEADMVVMTTPDLGNYYIKRSFMQKDIEYIFVPHDPSSMHMGFREHSLDNFDTVFCTGPHIAEEVRASEKVYSTKEKTLVEFGYPLIENLIESYENQEKTERTKKQILIAPSWQEDNLLDSCIRPLIDSLYGDDYKIIVRPHPEYLKRYNEKMTLLIEEYKDKIGENLEFELDFSSSASVYGSDLLVTDWSGIGIEFPFATAKPAIFINTKMKVENENYEKIGITPQEIKLRDILGVSLEKENLDKTFPETVKKLLNNKEFTDKLITEREKYFYNLGSKGSVGGKYIVNQLINKSKK